MKRAAVILAIAIIAGTIAVYFLLTAGYLSQSQATDLTVDQIKAQAIPVSYTDLVKNNGQYVGKIIYCQGEVKQIFDTNSNFQVVLVAMKDPSFNVFFDDNIVWINFNGPQLNEGDIIDIWGRVEGMNTYRPTKGSPKTLPEITILYGDFVPG